MKNYHHSVNIKSGLIIFGLVLIISLLVYSRSIVNKLRDDNMQIVQMYAQIIAATIKDESDAGLSFVFDEIITKVQFPIIYSDRDQTPINTKNLDKDLSVDELRVHQKTMDVQNNPIALEFVTVPNELITIGYLHYGDSTLIRQLEWLPYLEISAVAIFIILGFAGFTFIRNSEKKHIWVGMARETAHQLGTPVSALMGWLDLIKQHPNKTDQVLEEITVDMRRLEQIVERFSKMGSESKFVEVELHSEIRSVVTYLERRLPSMGKQVNISINITKDLRVTGNSILLSWALENILKNSVDAIDHDHGLIEINGQTSNGNIFLNITDNGKGISRKDWKNIFRPGFSSKANGWGLGLSLVKRIIEEIHSGKIEVIDSSVNEGSTMQLTLPG